MSKYTYRFLRCTGGSSRSLGIRPVSLTCLLWREVKGYSNRFGFRDINCKHRKFYSRSPIQHDHHFFLLARVYRKDGDHSYTFKVLTSGPNSFINPTPLWFGAALHRPSLNWLHGVSVALLQLSCHTSNFLFSIAGKLYWAFNLSISPLKSVIWLGGYGYNSQVKAVVRKAHPRPSYKVVIGEEPTIRWLSPCSFVLTTSPTLFASLVTAALLHFPSLFY